MINHICAGISGALVGTFLMTGGTPYVRSVILAMAVSSGLSALLNAIENKK